MVDQGSGTPIVLIPGLQGRWEWMRPTVAALARRHRVITFSLCDERTSGFPCDPARGFENFVDQVDRALDRAGLPDAAVAGVSYGGLIAAEYAARRPARVSRLVLASALHPTWRPDPFQQRLLGSPVLMSPLFVATAPRRMNPEIAAAIPGAGARFAFKVTHAARVAVALTSPARMAQRITWALAHPFADLRTLPAPSLVVTGEPGLDQVVPVEVTCRYLQELPAVRHVVLPGTGHLGCVTKPEAFAGVLGRFVNDLRLCA
jgi:pimeloyl-ACP methyl ester carboxylesterase